MDRRRAGLGRAEPAAGSGSTRRSPESDSNRRPLPYHGSALPTELSGRRGQFSGAGRGRGAGVIGGGGSRETDRVPTPSQRPFQSPRSSPAGRSPTAIPMPAGV